MMRIPALGLCRISMLVDSGFQTTGTDLDDDRSLLCATKRLEQRMRWSGNLCLSTILWQTNPDFTLIVGFGLVRADLFSGLSAPDGSLMA